MEPSDFCQVKRSAYRLGLWGAAMTLSAALASGPVAMGIVSATHPQPAWAGPELYAQSYHPIQALPFFAGYFLVTGFVILLAALHVTASVKQKGVSTVALVFTTTYASFVLLNYALQTTFVPELARQYVGANAPLVSALTMQNPTSLAWSLEMWGYGFLGVATWLVAPVFSGGSIENAAALTFRANGPISVGGALWTAVAPGWVQTPPGLVAFAAWNLLVVVMASLAFLAFRRRLRAHTEMRGETSVLGHRHASLA